MINRIVLCAATLAIAAGAVVAQESPIKARKSLMKATGDKAKIVAAMAKGEQPFDLATAKGIFGDFAETAAKAPDLFPENSKTGEDTAALPKIWESMSDFKARFVKLGQDAKEAQSATKDFESFKASLGTVGKNCGGCHELYRVKKS